jgi:hypothetical protein
MSWSKTAMMKGIYMVNCLGKWYMYIIWYLNF